ncbi:uncharacterized protein LOC129903678 [Solanum dulcamara]|uniref:uncharacterized protein LOC129903678 n=1 Tax=Solanum dulcamara TaxID=45834 RepID=UPI002485B806|nr:uncharacterized protein LOC129903678 [Solanum dulcamara]
MSHLDGMMVMQEKMIIFIKDVHPYSEVEKLQKYKSPIISAISVERGLKKRKDTFLAALVEVKPNVKVDAPECVAHVLEDFKVVMPLKLLKILPPRRDIDHKIELLLGSIASAQAPYRMSPKKLTELRKQLNELLDTGLIQPSKASYETSAHGPKEVQAIVDWQGPKGVKDLRSFLGLANYYRKFIAGYSKKAASLMDLLKKDVLWVWSDKHDSAFKMLKEVIASEPILRLSDFELPFEVHTNASNKDVGGVLVQEGHPVAFESRKLNNAEKRYSTHEKEMVAVEHRPRRSNQVADALSRKKSVEWMLALLSREYFWPNMEDDMEEYVKTCLVCQLDKTELTKEAGLLQPLPISKRPWMSVSMDFIGRFPKITSKFRHHGLIPKYDGTFEVIQKVGEVSYRLKLPERLKLHPTFHVSFLKPFYEDAEDSERNQSKRAPALVRT